MPTYKQQDEKAESTIRLQPKRISPRHRALMRRLASGMQPRDAAEDLGFSLARVSIVINSPLFQEELKLMQEEINSEHAKAEANRITADPVRALLSESAIKAARTLDGALSDGAGAVRVSAAKDILDRNGYAKEDNVNMRHSVEPSEALLNLLSRMTSEHGRAPISPITTPKASENPNACADPIIKAPEETS